MQKKLVALAVLGLISSAAFAETSVVIGGKYDAGYQFKRTANVDAQCGTTNYCGGTTTETLGDGSASTSRITIQAKEDLMPGWSAMVDLDLRFGTIEEGKTGLNNNDKKVLSLTSPVGTVYWGVYNATGENYYLSEKPYMISPKDLEIVKYGIASYRMSALTNRETELRSKTINLGPVGLAFEAGYAIGDKRKDGSSNVAQTQSATVLGQQNSGDAKSYAVEYKVGDLVNGGINGLHRNSTTLSSSDGQHYTRLYTSVKPIKGLKFAVAFINQSGYGNGQAYQDKITNYVLSYNLNDKLEIGGEISKVRDVAATRNSGRGYMFGAAYFLSKGTYVYAARQKNDWARNEKGVAGGKYDGTATNFTGTADKLDMTYTRVGIVKEF